MLSYSKENYVSIKTYINQNKEVIGEYPDQYNEVIVSKSLFEKLNKISSFDPRNT